MTFFSMSDEETMLFSVLEDLDDFCIKIRGYCLKDLKIACEVRDILYDILCDLEDNTFLEHMMFSDDKQES